eukprot:TRINITY_DN5761_c0_g1_i1.p2 TRINITY_DN5761_c0_g1~~TRINITY_DN5761_c0_g1_i1.p2  ORF type:complete len:226 (-),score=-11.91 TRINITY_DN5761_c0_g1_i1:291-968(-)
MHACYLLDVFVTPSKKSLAALLIEVDRLFLLSFYIYDDNNSRLLGALRLKSRTVPWHLISICMHVCYIFEYKRCDGQVDFKLNICMHVTCWTFLSPPRKNLWLRSQQKWIVCFCYHFIFIFCCILFCHNALIPLYLQINSNNKKKCAQITYQNRRWLRLGNTSSQYICYSETFFQEKVYQYKCTLVTIKFINVLSMKKQKYRIRQQMQLTLEITIQDLLYVKRFF